MIGLYKKFSNLFPKAFDKNNDEEDHSEWDDTNKLITSNGLSENCKMVQEAECFYRIKNKDQEEIKRNT